MARTTVDLEAEIIRELKHLAAESNESMSRVLNRLVLSALEALHSKRDEAESFEWRVAAGTEPAPGFDPSTRDYLDALQDDEP